MADYLASRAAVNKNLAKDKEYIIKTILFISQGQEDTDFKDSIHHQCLLEREVTKGRGRKMEIGGRDQVTNMPLTLSEKNTKNNTEGHG